MQSVFVTGTDTGVGKTRVSCALMRQLIAQGQRVVGMKPVASGAFYHAGKLVNDDAQQLMASANVAVPYEWVNPYCFEAAIAPHIAAQKTGVVISPSVILNSFQKLVAVADVVVVEGVGGWAVPINATQTMADVAEILNLPVIMVVGMRLGCLNHAILTATSIHSSHLQHAAWVANALEPTISALQENIDTLKEVFSAPLIGVMPYQADLKLTDSNCFNLTLL